LWCCHICGQHEGLEHAAAYSRQDNRGYARYVENKPQPSDNDMCAVAAEQVLHDRQSASFNGCELSRGVR
jgi:hypothetical protein